MSPDSSLLTAALTSRRYAILSAFQNSSPEFNERRHAILKNRLRRATCAFAELEGRWNGVPEKSVLILGVSPWNVAELARLFVQEAFIHNGVLYSRTGSVIWPDYRARRHSTGHTVFDTKPAGNFSKLGDTYFTLNF